MHPLLCLCLHLCLCPCLTAPAQQVNAYMFGSVPLRTYLPDGDIDLSVFCSQDVAQSMRDTWALKLQSVIEQEQRNNSNAPYKIGDVTVINAEVCWGCCLACLPQLRLLAMSLATAVVAAVRSCP